MKPTLDLDNPIIPKMFASLQPVLKAHEVDYFLIGALARDVQLFALGGPAAERKTNDVDIAILVDAEEQFYRIKEALIQTGEFEEAERSDIKLLFRHAVELDILPFGAIEDDHRGIRLARRQPVVLDMHGFQEVYPFVQEHALAPGVSLKVCTIEALILLKLFANADDPSRTKDITDIEQLVAVYFDLNSNEIYDTYFDVLGLYEAAAPQEYPQLVAAQVIGRKIHHLLANAADTLQKLKAILQKRPTAIWQAILNGVSE